MVSARTAAFFALIVACASHVFASPLPTFNRQSREITSFETIKAYERRALTYLTDIGKRAGGINTMPAEMATTSDGTSIKAYGRRQVDTTDIIDTTTTTGGNNLAAPSDSIIVPAEVATSSDGSGPVPIRKRAGGINTMPAEMATTSDGTSIKAYGRRQIDIGANNDQDIDPKIQSAAGVDGQLTKRAGGINTMPAEMATSSDGTSIKAYGRRQIDVGANNDEDVDPTTTDTTAIDPTINNTLLATPPDDSIIVPAEVAVSSDGSGPVPIRKRAGGINTMPAEMATTSDGTSIKAYGK